MTKQITEITELTKYSITDDIINGAYLYGRIGEDADDATIYTGQ